MGDRPDDLVPLLTPQPGDAGAVRWGQGVVVTWDSETGENTVNFRGANLINLPIVASSSEVLVMQPGDVVGLNIVGNGAAATIYIVGRITQPGPEARDIIRQALASGTVVDQVLATESTTSTSFTDLTTAGPAVTATIGLSGKCLVWLSATLDPTTGDGPQMSVAVSGATTRAADHIDTNRLLLGNGSTDQVSIGVCNVTLLEGLTPGSNTFTAKYKSTFGATVFIGNRAIVVMPF